MKFAFFTLGCKVNLFETQALSQLAAERGHEIVDSGADAVIINTCTVTSVSDHKNIRAFHRLRRDNPRAVIAACGCFAQTDPERVRATGEIDLICGTRDRAQVIDLCEQAVSGQAVQVHESEDSGFETLPAGIPHGRTRALLKIEDGCNNFCTYCIIPYARGRVRSLPVEQALEQTVRLADAGVHEIVLTGIEIASYGKDFKPQVPLTELLEKLLTAQPNVQFRLGSLDPRAVDDAFCERLAGFANLARHFHLSMQSGCDTVLRRMNRHYTSEEFYRCVERLRRAFPDCSVTTDLIVGFPGETEDEFAELCEFLQNVGIERVGVFEYSPEEGTEAAELPDQIDDETKQNRRLIVEELQSGVLDDYNTSRHGEVMQVLCEGFDEEQGLWYGRTYADSVEVDGHVYFDAADNEPAEGEFVSVLITESLGPDLLGVRQKEA